jgi:hypothetical protein
MKTEPQRTCPSCGNDLSGAMEFCPVCLLRKGLSDGVESGESSIAEDGTPCSLPVVPGVPSTHGLSCPASHQPHQHFLTS